MGFLWSHRIKGPEKTEETEGCPMGFLWSHGIKGPEKIEGTEGDWKISHGIPMVPGDSRDLGISGD